MAILLAFLAVNLVILSEMSEMCRAVYPLQHGSSTGKSGFYSKFDKFGKFSGFDAQKWCHFMVNPHMDPCWDPIRGCHTSSTGFWL